MRKPVNFIVKALDAFMEYHGIRKGETFTLYDRYTGEACGTACISPSYLVSFNGEEWREDRVDELLRGNYTVAYREHQETLRVRGFEFVSGKLDARLPERATENSAGYDFFAREDVTIFPHTTAVVWTGIKAYMPKEEVLKIYNRSSNPTKKGLVLANSVGIVDADYYNNPDNEGDIGFCFWNITDEIVVIKKGDKLGQGIFETFGLADNDIHGGTRVGGFGSTGK